MNITAAQKNDDANSGNPNNAYYIKDTIVAIATASGYAGVGIVRISGTNLLPLIPQLTLQLKSTINLKPRYAYYVDFIENMASSIANKVANSTPNTHQIIDSGVLIYFPAPHSFTGEDIIELHGHGNPIVLQMLIKQCLSLGCRLAEAGEFSKRAYLNGKIDLVQAESILDLIHAESEAAALGAIKSLHGAFSKHINQVHQQLINLRMFVEATLDFPEEDIEFIANAKIKDKVINLQNNLNTLLKNTQCGVLLNNGINIVIIGRPNVGKSSLLNSLANEEVAIVTDIAGTTRDIIREKITIKGIVCNIIDTAGIRQTNDIVENIGIERAIAAIHDAHICLILIDETVGITHEDEQILAKIPSNMPQIFVHNKIDLIDDFNNDNAKKYTGTTTDDPIVMDNPINVINQPNQNPYNRSQLINQNQIKPSCIKHIYISAKQRIGLDVLQNTILQAIGFEQPSNATEDVFIARTRHLDAVNRTIKYIENALHNWQHLEILAEELRYGHNALSEITGEFTNDDLLGEIFSKFCIGK